MLTTDQDYLIHKTLFVSITGTNRLILVSCQTFYSQFSLSLFLVPCATSKILDCGHRYLRSVRGTISSKHKGNSVGGTIITVNTVLQHFVSDRLIRLVVSCLSSVFILFTSDKKKARSEGKKCHVKTLMIKRTREVARSGVGCREQMKRDSGIRPRWKIERCRNPHGRCFHQDQTPEPFRLAK